MDRRYAALTLVCLSFAFAFWINSQESQPSLPPDEVQVELDTLGSKTGVQLESAVEHPPSARFGRTHGRFNHLVKTGYKVRAWGQLFIVGELGPTIVPARIEQGMPGFGLATLSTIEPAQRGTRSTFFPPRTNAVTFSQ